MEKVVILQGCGSGHNVEQRAQLNLDCGDFFIMLGGKRYRFSIDPDNSITIALINGVDAKITTHNGYPAIKLNEATGGSR